MDANLVEEVKILDHTQKQKVEYCIPLWLRDEQIKLALKRVKKRLQPVAVKRPEPIAVVCFGPSLNDTWEEIRNYPYVISCSGAHKFLIERGIVPNWHVEVDPRPHKIQLIGQPHPGVEYVMAATVHPAVFDHLEGYNVCLWHVFENKADALRLLPPSEWALTGGASVGLRAMTVARFLGFTKMGIFGMDGSEGASGKHAAAHPNQPPAHSLVEYEGVTYKTTPSMLECARQTWHELDQMNDVEATFYGEGLVQAMSKNYVRKEKSGEAVIAFSKPELISAEYAELNRKLHVDNLGYGVGGGKYAQTVLDLVKAIGSQSVLDYGCGKGYLAKELPFPIWEYDPGVPGKEESPRPADIVVCTDVLEHIEPDKLQYVLFDLARVTKKVGYFVIHTGPASKVLADGRNAHLIQQGQAWWEAQLKQFFQVGKIFNKAPLLFVVVSPKIKKKKVKKDA